MHFVNFLGSQNCLSGEKKGLKKALLDKNLALKTALPDGNLSLKYPYRTGQAQQFSAE